MMRKNSAVTIAQERAIFGVLEGAARPLDFLELQKRVGSRMTATEFPRVLTALVNRKTIEQTTRSGETMPVYSLNLFKAQRIAKRAKKSAPARAPVRAGKPRVTSKKAVKVAPKAKAAPKVKAKFGSLGTKTQQICSVRRRDVATGQLLKGCLHPSGYIYAPDGTKVRVKVTSCADDGVESWTYKVISAEIPADLKADLRKASPAERASFKKNYLEALQDELNAANAADIGNRELVREVRSSIGQRAARTRADNAAKAVKAGKAKAGSPDKARAQNELEAVKARIGAAKAEGQKTKSVKKLATLKRRIAKLEKASTQLEKIAAGRASKFPTAGQLR